MTLLTTFMESKLCGSLRTLYREIKSLNKKFELAAEEAQKTRNFDDTRRLEKKILSRIEKIRSHTKTTPELAKEIFGEDFLGSEAFEKAFGFKSTNEVPSIPFSPRRLEKAKEDGFCLIYRPASISQKPGKGPDEPLDIETMELFIRAKLINEYYSPDEAKKATDNLTQSCLLANLEKVQVREGWALVSKKPLPDTENKDYLEQTDVLARYIEEQIHKKELGMQNHPFLQGQGLSEYLDSDGRKSLEKLMSYTSEKKFNFIVTKINQLKILSLNLPNAAEVVYDSYLYQKINGRRLYEDTVGIRTVDENPLSNKALLTLKIWSPSKKEEKLFPYITADWYLPTSVGVKTGFVLSMRA